MSNKDISEETLKLLVQTVVRSEINDLVKTVNRIYEDREDITDIKQRVGTLEDVLKDVVERLRKFEKNTTADIKDVTQKVDEVQGSVEEVTKAITEGEVSK